MSCPIDPLLCNVVPQMSNTSLAYLYALKTLKLVFNSN